MSASHLQQAGRLRLSLAIAGSILFLWSVAHAWLLGGPIGFGVAAFSGWCFGITWLHFAANSRRRIEWISRDDEGATRSVSSIDRPFLSIRGQWGLFGVLVVGQSWLFAFLSNTTSNSSATVDASGFAIGWLAASVIAFAVRKLIRALASAEVLSSLSTPLGLITLAIPVSALVAAALFLSPHDEGITSSIVGYLIVALAVVLALDSFLKQLTRILEPPAQRGPASVPGTGFVLEMAGAGGRSRFFRRFEELTGTRLEEVAGVRFLSERLGPSLALGLSLLWISTAITVVPLGSSGIRQHFGAFATPELGPGLHLSLPRPLGKILVVDTGKVREIAVGFENDLLGPVLWNERHFEGEENFLVGEGDEVLTVNMPVLYRIAKPREFLVNAQDADMAVRSLAEKELLSAISGRSLFDLIGPQREAIAGEVQASLRNRVDELGLGLEILFVGLKDMHPPVQVSDAYQGVASAEEDRETFVENARATAVSQLGFAKETAHRLQGRADLDFGLRLFQARGAAQSFRARAEADLEGAGLIRDRLYYQALVEALADRDKIILPAGGKVSITIDHRSDSPNLP